jgi:AcrR family transcriptional regulator
MEPPMPPRSYRQGRRAEAAEETRRRIVEAAFALHEARGIAATSMKDIAARADVGVGTVYHHFPTYEDVVRACGASTLARVPPPAPEILDGVTDVPARVERLVAALMAFYEQLPVLERLRCERDALPIVAELLAEEERHRTALVEAALRPCAPDAGQVRIVTALLDVAVCRTLLHAVGSSEEAARLVHRLVLAALDEG